MLHRLNTMLTYFDTIRKGLETSVQAYNNTVGSLESRLLPQARRFHEMAPNQAAPLVDIKLVNKFPREILIPQG
jgi:DNA recombination protein RmuC